MGDGTSKTKSSIVAAIQHALITTGAHKMHNKVTHSKRSAAFGFCVNQPIDNWH